MGVSENISALMRMYDLDQPALARAVGVNKSTVSNWVTKGRKPQEAALSRLCNRFRLTRDDILSDAYGLAAKERGDFVGAGYTFEGELGTGVTVDRGGRLYLNGHPAVWGNIAEPGTVSLCRLADLHARAEDTADGGLSVDIPTVLLAKHPNCCAVLVEDDAMDRVALPGQVAVFDYDLKPRNGDVVVIEEYGSTPMIRRWMKGGDTLLLVADSHVGYPDIVIRAGAEPYNLWGVVFWVQSAEELA